MIFASKVRFGLSLFNAVAYCTPTDCFGLIKVPIRSNVTKRNISKIQKTFYGFLIGLILIKENKAYKSSNPRFIAQFNIF